jgi:hypothetical protein
MPAAIGRAEARAAGVDGSRGEPTLERYRTLRGRRLGHRHLVLVRQHHASREAAGREGRRHADRGRHTGWAVESPWARHWRNRRSGNIDAIDLDVPVDLVQRAMRLELQHEGAGQEALSQVEVGDKVDLTWTEALLVSVAASKEGS